MSEEGAPRPAAAAVADAAPATGRLPALRLATLHLRMGMLPLARAELEAAAGRGRLDDIALLDLAEARWRSGDLAGAGEAAHAAIEKGLAPAIAYLIAAESIAALGRPSEARRLAGHAVELSGGSLDTLFAGMPRSAIWPTDETPVEGSPAPAAPRQRSPGATGPASAAAAEAFAGGRAALASGDVAAASLRLGVAIRLEPGFAQGVLDAMGDRASEPALALVAGDALRLLGRESEALAAFDRARGRPVATQDPAPEPPSDDEG